MIVKHIKKKKHCVGCFACFSICPQSCISMDSDEEGFWYPQVDYDKCIECNLCIQVCPILNKISVQNQPKAYACINNDETIRLESSSGGIFTLNTKWGGSTKFLPNPIRETELSHCSACYRSYLAHCYCGESFQA